MEKDIGTASTCPMVISIPTMCLWGSEGPGGGDPIWNMFVYDEGWTWGLLMVYDELAEPLPP